MTCKWPKPMLHTCVPFLPNFLLWGNMPVEQRCLNVMLGPVAVQHHL